jgi:hypothetical protein
MNDLLRRRRALLLGFAAVVLALLVGAVLGVLAWRSPAVPPESTRVDNTSKPPRPSDRPDPGDREPTLVYAHNLMLLKGPDFRIYIDWIAGKLVRTRQEVNPSFDDPDSFVLQIDKGIIHANIGDISNYLNHTLASDAPLKNISIVPDGEQVKIRGTVKKIIPLPIEIAGTPAATQGGLVRLNVAKISVLKIPMKGILGHLDVKLQDLVKSTNMPGVEVTDNDIIFDTEKLLPPPHIHGQLTTVRVRVPDIEVIYGNAPVDPSLGQWHNFIRFRNGALDFGKLTMHHVDLTMIDAANEPWFDLDLVNYQSQLVSGTTRMTAQAGLEIYMPSLKDRAIRQPNRSVTLEWLKNRNTSLPPDVAAKTKAP